MKPGAIAWPPTSTTVSAAPDNLPISTILPFLTATSPWNDAIPEPSTTRPFLIKTSYAILCPPVRARLPLRSTIAPGRRPVVGDCAPPGSQRGDLISDRLVAVFVWRSTFIGVGLREGMLQRHHDK